MDSAWQRRLREIGVVFGMIVQLVLVLIGVGMATEFGDDGELDAPIFFWCLLATIYGLTMVIALSFAARATAARKEYRPSRIQANVAVRITALLSALISAFVGIASAFMVVVLRNDPTDGWWYKLIGVWAMVLAWGLVHWGYAQWYYARYYANDVAPMEFPGTDTPHLVDFVYFAFTVGTSFAASDVTVRTRDLRWRVTVHGVIAFFFNSAIIVLALSTLTGSS